MFDFLLLISAITLLTVDFIYLNLVKNYFAWQVKRVQGDAMTINYFAAALCYIFLIVGLNYFIIKPRRSPMDAFLLGLVIYGVFETTNMALFKNWSIFTVIIDTVWGGILFALTTTIVYKLKSIF